MIDRLANRVTAMNKANSFINKHAAVLREHIQNNPYRLKSDGELFKKDKRGIYSILPAEMDQGVRWWIQVSKHSGISLHVSVRYTTDQTWSGGHPTSSFSACSYVEHTNFRDLPIYDLDKVRVLSAELPDLQDQYIKLNSRIQYIKGLVHE